MAGGLLDAVQDFVTPAFVLQASACLNERPERTECAMRMAVPAIVRGLIEWSSAPGGAEELLDLTKHAATRVDLAALPPPADLIPRGRGLPSAIFCTSFASVVDRLAAASGLRGASASSLLSVLTPLVLAAAAREVAFKMLDAASLRIWLVSQRDEVTPFLPSGLAEVIASGNRFPPPAKADTDDLDVMGAIDALAAEFARSLPARAVPAEMAIPAPLPPPPAPVRPWTVSFVLAAIVVLLACYLALAWN